MKRLIPLLALLLLAFHAPRAFSAIAIVQQCTNTSGTNTVTCTFTNPVTSGNAIIWSGLCLGSTTAAFSSIADDKTDTYPAPDVSGRPTGQSTAVMIGHLVNITTGPKILTLTGTGCTFEFGIHGYEVSGINNTTPVDSGSVVAAKNLAAAASPQTQAYTTAGSGELAIAAVDSPDAAFTVTSWTVDTTFNTNQDQLVHLLSPTSGSNTMSVTFTGTIGLNLGIVAYQPAGSGSPVHGQLYVIVP